MKKSVLNKVVFLCMAGLFTMVVSPCLNAQQQANNNNLIVYLSRTENTKVVAEMIQKEVGGKLVSIELENSYSENYRSIVDQVDRENERGYLPPLKTEVDDIEQYDIIFIGFPTWDMQMPPPMKSFLDQTDLSGKTIIPFNTNAGYGVGSGFEQVKQFSPDANILEGFSVEGGHEKEGVFLAIKNERAREVKSLLLDWLQKIIFKAKH